MSYGDVIEGILKLPNGMAAREGGVDIKIRAGRTITATIPGGQNSIHYKVADSNTYISPRKMQTKMMCILRV